MKALPEAVQRAFPREAGDLPERPWWYKSREGRNGADCYRRNDDPHTSASTVEEVATYDAAHPLPHPGYRAGQVWAQGDGSSATICATYTHPNAHVICIGKAQFREETVARIYPYLMADPACPHLAPWSPVEKP